MTRLRLICFVAVGLALLMLGALLQTTATATAATGVISTPQHTLFDPNGGVQPFTITLTITKVVVGAAPVNDWQFNGAPEIGDFSIPAGGGAAVFTVNALTNYTVTEVVKPGFHLTVDCGVAEWAPTENGVVVFGTSFDAACTFTNTQYARVTVTKKAIPSGEKPFYFYTSNKGAFTLVDDGSGISNTKELTQVVPGNLIITELTLPGWRTTSDCDYEHGAGGVYGSNQVSVTLAPGAHALCTFTNTMNTITVIKNATPESSQKFDFHWQALADPTAAATNGESLPTSGAFQLLDDGSAVGQSYVITQTLAGRTYVISENIPPGWKLNEIKCNDNTGAKVGEPVQEEGAVYLEISDGQQYTCTFGNIGPSIALTKTVGRNPAACATTNQLTVLSGTKVYYCFTVENTGPVTLTKHSLQDSVLGQVLSDVEYDLGPGATFAITQVHTATVGVTNVATWTASLDVLPNPPDGDAQAAATPSGAAPTPIAVTANATATVTVTPLQPAIELRKTVGVAPTACATTSEIIVPSGTTVYYCYTVKNTGNITLPLHTLVDNKLGNLLVNFPYALGPGQSVSSVEAGQTISAVITSSTDNTATWTAGVPGGGSVSASATARVQVGVASISVSKTVSKVATGCGAATTISVLAGEAVYFCVTVQNTGDFTFTYHMIDDPLHNFKTAIPYVLKPGDKVIITRDLAPQLGPVTVNNPITNSVTFTSSTHLPAAEAAQVDAAQPVIAVAAATGVAVVRVDVPTAMEETPEPSATLPQRLYLPLVTR